MIKRDQYLQALVHAMGNGYVKIITGVRRCGKSYLLNTIFYEYLLTHGIDKKHIIRFAFDSVQDLSKMGENPLQLAKEKRLADPVKFMAFLQSQIQDNRTYYLLLDEVQELGSFETVLNACLRQDNFDVFVTGSNAKFLSKDIITEFAGRGDQISMQPLSFAEFMSCYAGDKYEGLTEYMLHGGLPQIVLEPEIRKKKALLASLFQEIYIRDIEQRNHLRHGDDLQDILDVLSSSIGSFFNPEKIANTLKSTKKSSISSPTVKKYIGFLEDSFLVSGCCQYNIKGRKYIGSSKKYYICDTGLRNVRLNFRQFEQTHIMENVIYNELLRRGYSVDVGMVEIYDKNATGANIRKKLEVDFVCNNGTERLYLQSAFSIPDEQKRQQEIRPYRHIADSFKKVIITKDIIPIYYDEEGILNISIYDFLLDQNALASR